MMTSVSQSSQGLGGRRGTGPDTQAHLSTNLSWTCPTENDDSCLFSMGCRGYSGLFSHIFLDARKADVLAFLGLHVPIGDTQLGRKELGSLMGLGPVPPWL